MVASWNLSFGVATFFVVSFVRAVHIGSFSVLKVTICMSTVAGVSRLRRVFSGLTVTGVLLAGVVVAVADPTVGPVQAAPNISAVLLSQLGADIDGEAAGDFSGWSVALSADGGTAIIGAPGNDDAGSLEES